MEHRIVQNKILGDKFDTRQTEQFKGSFSSKFQEEEEKGRARVVFGREGVSFSQWWLFNSCFITAANFCLQFYLPVIFLNIIGMLRFFVRDRVFVKVVCELPGFLFEQLVWHYASLAMPGGHIRAAPRRVSTCFAETSRQGYLFLCLLEHRFWKVSFFIKMGKTKAPDGYRFCAQCVCVVVLNGANHFLATRL